MWQAVLDGLKAAWDWFVGVIVGFGQHVIAFILGLLPTSFLQQMHDSANTIGWALSAANAWLPLDVFFTLAVAYMAFILLFLAVKIIIKLIP